MTVASQPERAPVPLTMRDLVAMPHLGLTLVAGASGLDRPVRWAHVCELARIQRTAGTTFVHVTHDQEEAMALADAVVVLSHGRIEDHGPPERVYLRPASRFTAGFMGDSNVLEGTLVERDGDLGVETPLGWIPVVGEVPGGPGSRAVVSIRPEHLRVDGSGGLELGRGEVRERHFSGMYQRCYVTVGDLELMVFAPLTRRLTPGQTVPLSVDPADVVLLPRD